MSDGDLRKIFQKYLFQGVHWQAIETWSTGQGVPDLEYCFEGGISGWVEMKLTAGFAVDLSPHQVAWLRRRARMGGRVFIAVRRKTTKGPRRGAACDELFLFHGSHAGLLKEDGLKSQVAISAAHRYSGGPSNWDWLDIKCRLTE